MKVDDMRDYARHIRFILEIHELDSQKIDKKIKIPVAKKQKEKLEKVLKEELTANHLELIELVVDKDLTELERKTNWLIASVIIAAVYFIAAIVLVVHSVIYGWHSIWLDFMLYIGNAVGFAYGVYMIRSAFKGKSLIDLFIGVIVLLLNGFHVLSFLDYLY